MTPVAYATKRLWLKRWNRVGFIVLWPFMSLSRFGKYYFKELKNDPFWTILGTIVAVGVFSLLMAFINSMKLQFHDEEIASTEDISKARNGDRCVKTTLVARAAQLTRPITNRDIRITIRDCKEYWEKQKGIEAQAAALK